MPKLTEKKYWDEKYGDGVTTPLSLEGFRQHTFANIFETMKLADLEGKSILEIGAGGSQWLTFLAREFPTSEFAGLDYSEAGCEDLRKRAESEGVFVDIVCADLYCPPENYKNKFDIVITFGVVEHFDSLDDILPALLNYLKPNGKLYTLIPNMAALMGTLTKKYDQSVYDIHNPHDRASLVDGHKSAGLQVEYADYIGSTEFGILSSCINENSGRLKKFTYLWLTRLTRAISFFEHKFGNLPATPYFSGLIYCIASRAK